jgi:hypothetical protein
MIFYEYEVELKRITSANRDDPYVAIVTAIYATVRKERKVVLEETLQASGESAVVAIDRVLVLVDGHISRHRSSYP